MKIIITALLAAAAALTSARPLHQPDARGGVGRLETRSRSGKMTWYQPGEGACGVTNTASDMIVAVPAAVYGTYANPNSSPMCKKTVRITGGGKTVQAAIKDKCLSCGAGDIDVSPAVFSKFGDLSRGTMGVSWVVN